MKNIKNRSIVDFDITPLLDVIFIVLMVVMSHQVVNSNISDKEFVTVQEQLDETVAENELHKTQLYAYENADSLVAYVTLRADYEVGNPKTRNIQFTYNNDISYIEITITPDNEEESYKLLEEKLIEFLSNNSEIPVLLVLNEDQILYRDQVTISEMLKNLRVIASLRLPFCIRIYRFFFQKKCIPALKFFFILSKKHSFKIIIHIIF